VIDWLPPVAEGDNRSLAMCGHVAVGAVFHPGPRGRYWRWRVWCTHKFNPVEGTARSEDAARTEVTERFMRFLELAGLSKSPAAPVGSNKPGNSPPITKG